jgi:serine/threonine protein phosphatase PrpC
MSLRFEDASRTDAGCVRTVNEDACLARSEDALWAVADGMGGHANGGWASAQIVAALAAERCPEDIAGAVTAARSALARVNTAIHRMSLAQRRVIGSTVAVLVLRERRFAVLWCGDSRVYRLRDGVLAALTTDHSQVEQMVASGLISREEAEEHPMAHMLSRAIGVREEAETDLRMGDVLPGDMFLLCSDGLTRMVREGEIAQVLMRDTPRRSAQALVDLALERGLRTMSRWSSSVATRPPMSWSLDRQSTVPRFAFISAIWRS